MDGRWKGLLIGLLLGVLVAGLVAGVWLWWPKKPTYTPEEWLERIADDDLDAASELAQMGDFGLEVLLTARESNDIRVHRRAARAMVSFGEKAVPPLVKALPRARARAEVILVAIGEPAIPALEEALANDDTAPSAARVLGMMGERASSARPALMGVVQDVKRKDDARAEAAWALGQLGPDAAAAVVLGSAAGSSPFTVRERAIRALGLMGPAARPAVRVLVAALEHADRRVVELAAEALGQIGDASAVPALARLMARQPDSGAVEALARIGPSARAELGTLLDAPGGDRDGRSAAIRMLGPLVVPVLIERLKGPGPLVEVAEALAEAGPAAASARPGLEAVLKGRSRRNVLAAARALLHVTPTGHEKPAAALVRLLGRDEVTDRETLSLGLGGLGTTSPLAALSNISLAAEWEGPGLNVIDAFLGDVDRPSPTVVDALWEQMKHGNPPDGCIWAAGKAGPALRRLLPGFEAALKRESGPRDLQLARAVVTIAPDKAGPVVPVLRAGFSDRRTAPYVARVLSGLEEPPNELLEDLREGLQGDGAELALLALEGYPREGLIGIVPNIVPLLGASPPVARRACRLLLYIGPPALPFLRAMLSNKQLPAAATALNGPRMKLTNADINIVVKRLDDSDPTMRHAAATILAGQGARTPAAVAAARVMLDHIEPEMRAAGAKALHGTGEHKAALRECLFDPSAEVRANAARALAGDFDALRPALSDGDPLVRLEAGRGLLASDKDRADAVQELLRLGRAASAAGRVAVAEAIPEEAAELVPLLEADMRANCLSAAAWLVRHAPAKAEAALVRLMCGVTSFGTREEAARLLAELGAKARPALPWLRRQLRPGLTQAEREAVRDAIQRISAAK
jgi:HEAT repeat protein